VVFACLVALSSGHGWLISPQPRINPPITNTNMPCETATPSPNGTVVVIGVAFTVSWAHFHSGGNIILTYAPQAQATTQANFVHITTVLYDSPLNAAGAATTTISLPNSIMIGKYTLQWNWDSLKYYNCADLVAVPPGSLQVDGTNYSFGDGSGSINTVTGVVTCNSGYSYNSNTNSCQKSGLSSGAGFGIFVLVMFILGVAWFVGFVFYAKYRMPEVYEKYTSMIRR